MVTLYGSFSVNEGKVNQELKWVFLWRRTDEGTSSEQHIYVGRGFSGRDFNIHSDVLPRGERIRVCAFVEAEQSDQTEVAQMAGEEFEFDF